MAELTQLLTANVHDRRGTAVPRYVTGSSPPRDVATARLYDAWNGPRGWVNDVVVVKMVMAMVTGSGNAPRWTLGEG
ncbi:uncharacterized protein M6B38_353530 [Iris pallida]|uniref:Uncharacterized protein n=1 Tax=Iris pallida TaxID=29817 RepID=A0AAX6GPW2_IRIPA|nr:uncharacterized protein M6B38_353530 [Iris pallida]